MKITQLKLAMIATILTSTLAMASTSAISASTEQNRGYKIYVYKGCQMLDSIPMTQKQIKAYQALNAQETSMNSLEAPLKDMEQALEKYEDEMESLTGEMVLEDEEGMVINKKLIAQHEDIAKKMQNVVKAHQQDIQQLEQQAQKIKSAAHRFEKVIKPSLAHYQDQNVNVSIGTQEKQWQCEA